MDPNWDDASAPLSRQPKTPHTAASGRAATASTGQVRQWAKVPRRANHDATTVTASSSSRIGSKIQFSASTPGLALVGPGKFNIGDLHNVIQQKSDDVNMMGQCDDFFPAELGVPDRFQGLNPEENRPPAELFVWGQERAKRRDRTDTAESPSPWSLHGCKPEKKGPCASLPGIRRPNTAITSHPYTIAAGTKRKGPATAGGEGDGLGGLLAGRCGRRRAATEGGDPPTTSKNKYIAVQGSEGTWQFIARERLIRETPVSRGDAFGLVRDFETAMAVMDKYGVGGTDGLGGAFMSPIQNDMHGLQQEVRRVFGARTAVVEAVDIMGRGYKGRREGTVNDGGTVAQEAPWTEFDERQGLTRLQRIEGRPRHDEGGHLAGAGASPLDLTGDWVKSAVGMGPQDWVAAQRTLGNCLFEQKWLDLTCGELTDQVTVMCLPHGQLLQEIRRRNASAFNRLHGLYSDCLWTLDRCVASLMDGRRERKNAEEDWTRRLEATCAEYEAKIKSIHDSRGSEEQEQTRAKREARAHVDRMGDTLRTLNGIFKTMQADGKAMSGLDLKDRCRFLEQELASRKEEMQALRRLKEKHLETEAEMEQLKRELEKTKQQAVKAKEEMERRQSLVMELMDNEAKRLTQIETLKAGSDRIGSSNDDDGEGEDNEKDGPNAKNGPNKSKRGHKVVGNSGRKLGVGSKRTSQQGGENPGREDSDDDDDEEEDQEMGSSVLCIKCRKALDDLSNIADALEKERQLKGQTRLQCHGYRLLLPNLKGHKPPRTVVWVRTVMRAILRAKVWDDSVLRYKQDLRVRFPEFTYAWFEPPRTIMAAASASGKAKLVAQADDDRWGLYYGVKSLARESAEAAIFWHVLNESNGEDYLTFLVYCLAIVEGTAGSMLRDQWGISVTCTDLHTLKSLTEEKNQATEDISTSERNDARGSGLEVGSPRASGEERERQRAEPLASGRDVVWLRSSDAEEIVDHILVKALEDQKRKVLDATKAISVSCEGRLLDQDRSSKCVDLFLFLRILLHSFKEEQVNRRAAVRLMFETAATGVLTDGTPIYGDGRVDQSALAAAETVYNSIFNERKAVVDLPQFLVITRTLWPEVTTSDAVVLFRDAHEETNGEVDYQAFLKLADRWQFFSNALQLPVHMPSRADLGQGMDAATRSNLGALVHRHYNLMKPAVDAVKKTMPESAVKQLVKCQRAVERELSDAYMVSTGCSDQSSAPKPSEIRSGSGGRSGGSGGGGGGGGGEEEPEEEQTAVSPTTTFLDGTRPLAAYRRLLAILYHIRNVRHESGPGYDTALGKSTTIVQKTEAEFRALEAVFFDLHVDRRFETYERIRLRLAATKIQRTWRKVLARDCEVPLGLLGLMRPGYLRGVGGIVLRAVHHPPFWVQQQIAEVYAAKLRTDYNVGRYGLPIRGAASGPACRPLFWVAFDHLLRQWGTPELAERAAQDLYFNVRSLAPSLSRLRLFGAFSGCLTRETSGPSFEDDVEMLDHEALAFYLRAVTTFHRVRREMTAAGSSTRGEGVALGGLRGTTSACDGDEEQKKVLNTVWDTASVREADGTSTSASLGGLDMFLNDGPKPIEELFPVTRQDPRTGRQYWYESAAATEAVAQELFDKCSQSPLAENGPARGGVERATGRARVSGVQMSLGKLMGHPAITGGREKRVDVDDALWLFMRHWLVVRQHRKSLVDRALGQVIPGPSSTVAAQTVAAAAAADTDAAASAIPSPLVSVDSFRGVVSRFEKLSGSAPPRGVSDLVYGDAHLVALSLTRSRESKALSDREATRTALLSSPVLLWDVSGPRQEQQMPPTFSDRAMRSWLLSSWARFSGPIKAEVSKILQELQPTSDALAADGPITGASEQAQGPTVVHRSTGSSLQLADPDTAKLVRALEKVQGEVNRLDSYMKDLDNFERVNVAKISIDGRPSEMGVAASEVQAEEPQKDDQTLSPEVLKKLSRPGEVERASKEMRSLMTVLSAVYRRVRPNDLRDFVQDPWISGRRTSLRRTSFNSY